MDEAHFDRLLGFIYEASLEPGLWREAMNELAQQVGADTFHLLGWDSKHQTATLSVVSHDGWSDALARHNAHTGTPDASCETALQAGSSMVRGEAFDPDFLQHHGLRHVLGGCVYREGDTSVTLGLLRDPRRGPFEAAHELLLDRLVPHFNRALRLMEVTQAATRADDLAAAGQDAASLAVIAVDKAARLLHCNRTGEALLKAAQVLRVGHGIVACASEEEEKGFASALEIVANTGRPVNLLLCNRARPDERYSVTLTPQPRQGDFPLNGETGGVLCLVVPLDHRRMATTSQLMQLFALSAAEARLARAMAAGDTLDAYAVENDLKLPTVKSQLHAVFEKTGTDRQAALVRLITGIPAVREPG
jgi:DNA-binding CsgD family transcriptional regulator